MLWWATWRTESTNLEYTPCPCEIREMSLTIVRTGGHMLLWPTRKIVVPRWAGCALKWSGIKSVPFIMSYWHKIRLSTTRITASNTIGKLWKRAQPFQREDVSFSSMKPPRKITDKVLSLVRLFLLLPNYLDGKLFVSDESITNLVKRILLKKVRLRVKFFFI